MTVNIKLAKVNGALVPYPTSTPTIVSTAIGTLDQYSNTTAVLEFDAVTYANAVSYVNNKAFVNTAQLSSNLANYQTTAGLSANVATLSANNATFAFGKSENNLNVNSALSSNSSAYLGSANLQNIQTFITSNASAAYTNAVAYVDGKSFVNSSVNVTFTGIHVYSSNVTLNAGLIANGSIGTSGQILKSTGANVYWADGGAGSVTQINTANGLSGGPITTSGTIGIVSNSGIYVNASGVFVNSDYIATLASNSAGFLGNSSGTLINLTSWISSNAATAYTNSVAYVDGKAYVNTSQLSSNLANYQTTAGLAANVATLTSNNATFAYGKTENTLNVNSSLTANSSVYLGTANLNNIQTSITSNSATAYINAVSYVDGKAYVNTSQLSSNLANYALLTGATFSGNVRTQQSAQVDGNLVVSGNLTVSGNVTVIGANNLSVVDNMIYLNSNSTVANPDMGFAGNYNDGIYQHTGFFRDASDGVWKVFDSYLPEPDASPYIDTANSSFKIANFQANVVYVGNTTVYSTVNTTSFSGTANNSTFAYGKTEANLNVNNALTANSSTFVGTANLSNIQTFITSNASAAYTNAVAYVDGKAYVNTSQLSSNLANYQTTAGLAANVATLTANNTSFVGTISAANVVSNAQLASNLANYQTTAGLAANVAILAANSATYANASISNIFTVGTSTYFVSNGNVGIGTNTPTGLLHLKSIGPIELILEADTDNITETDNTRIIMKQDGGAVVGRIGYANNTNDLEVISEHPGSLHLGTNNSIKVTVDAGGNVGFGTVAPDARLAVTGTANVSGNVVIGGALTSANLTTTTANIGSVITSSVAVGANVSLDNGNNGRLFVGNSTVNTIVRTTAIAIQSSDGVNSSALFLVTDLGGRSAITLTGNVGSYIDFTTPSNAAEYNQRIITNTSSISILGGSAASAANNILLSSANVGIGTTTPNAKLAVTGTANVSGNVVIGGTLTTQSFVANTLGLYNTGTINAASYTVGTSFIANTTTLYHIGPIYSNNLYLQGDGTNAYIRATTGVLYLGTGGTNYFAVTAAGGGSFIPTTDNLYNLGSSTNRFANIYTGDLQLSNEGSEGNDIDHTTGSWTIQEGHENLYLINRKTGKKYMFVLKEV